MENNLTIIMPSYNEEESLREFLPQVLKFANEKNFKVIVVNDGSTDKTVDVLKMFENEKLLSVIHHKINCGYGRAIKSGVQSVTTKYVITIDADGQHYLSDIDNLYQYIINNDADLIVGSRRGQQKSCWYREVGKFIIRSVARVLLPLTIYDINSGMKIYQTELIKKYSHLCPDNMAFGDVSTLIFISQKHKVMEIPIKIKAREKGLSKIKITTAFETLMEILNIVVLFNPMRIFIPLSIISIFSGLVWGIPIVLRGRGVSVGSMLAIITGIIFFFMGLIAEQLSLIRKGKIFDK